MTKNTPTPWTTEPKPDCAWIGRIGNNFGDPEIWAATPTKSGGAYVFGSKRADADLIVRAVNAHNDLVKALERFLSFESADYDRASHRAKEIVEAKKQARAAIARAKQGG